MVVGNLSAFREKSLNVYGPEKLVQNGVEERTGEKGLCKVLFITLALLR